MPLRLLQAASGAARCCACHGSMVRPAAAHLGMPCRRRSPLPPAGWTIALQLSFWMCVTLSWLWGTLERYFPALFGEWG